VKVPHPSNRGFPTLKEIRAEHRAEMRRELVLAAARIVADEGTEGLTIKGLAASFGSSIGTIYRHFESKELLVAAVEATWMEDLATAANEQSDALSARLSGVDATRPVRSLAKVIDASTFWIDAFETQPVQLRYARHLVGNPDVAPVARAEATSRLLTPLRSALTEAHRARALDDGNIATRAGMIVTILPLPTCATHLWEAPQVDRDLGFRLLDCLLDRWGASSPELDNAKQLVGVGSH
jgi:AcrR family transcriptional regulator